MGIFARIVKVFVKTANGLPVAFCESSCKLSENVKAVNH